MEWNDWHQQYDTTPSLQARLRMVREQISSTLTESSPGPIRVVSVCAGDGRDIIRAVQNHPRRADVSGFLIDSHLESLQRGRAAAAAVGLDRQLQFVQADASRAMSYTGKVPADLLLISGVLGHLRRESVRGLIDSLSMLCRQGGWLIWNRHLHLNDGQRTVPEIREWLRLAQFREAQFQSTAPDGFACGCCRFEGRSVPLDSSRALFDFVGLSRLGSVVDDPPLGITSEAVADVEQSVPQYFERISGLHPNRKALGAGDWQPTYPELNSAANGVAHAILKQGGAAGDRIAVLMRHDTPQVAAVLSILKAGRIVVVLNPSDPPARLAQVLADAEPHLILSDSANQPLATTLATGSILVLPVKPQVANGCPDDPGLDINAHDTAFLVYTSGSTGRPKGIMQNHRNLLHNVWRLSRGMGLSADDRIMMPASLSGAHGVATMWCALMNGATLCPFPVMERGVTGLADWVNAHAITVFVASASLFRHFVKTLDVSVRFPRVRLLRLGSESATADDFTSFRRHFPEDGVLFHTLSSSETGNICQMKLHHDHQTPAGRLPVGVAAEGIEVLLVSEQGVEVEPGHQGEVVVRSRYLSPGYWRNPALTAERFSSVPGSADLRVYRTGDLGRFTNQGELVFLGRKDFQVKIRGYRIELSEVEDALRQQSEVDKAVVCAQTETNGDARLIACVVARTDSPCSAEQLRRRLQASLPSHMVPAVFVLFDELPLTPHGKVDREQLRNLSLPEIVPVNGDAPGTETEVLLAGIWCRELKCDRVVRESDFFDLGGDSLSAAVVAARLHADLKVELDLRAFLAHPRLDALASEVDRLTSERGREREVAFVRVSRDEPLPLSFAQERTWRASGNTNGATSYTMACSHRLQGQLDVDLLRDCVGVLACRHEILRSTFREIDGRPVQVVQEPEPMPLPLTDLSTEPDAEEQAMAWLGREARQLFDLARGPLLRLRLLRVRDDEHWLLRTNHHIISDGWSWKVYFRELALLYEARLQGKPSPLPEFEPLQYADYAAWQRRILDPNGGAYQEAVRWWSGQFSGKPHPVEPRARRLKRVREVDPSQGFIWWGVETSVSQRLEQLGREVGATYYAVRLAAFAALLSAESGRSDILLGTYVTNRTRVESQGMFGFFSNPATLRLCFDRRQTFRDWVETVQETVAETQARGEIPYEQLQEELQARGVKVTDARVTFTVSDNAAPVRFGGLELTALDRHVEVPGGFCLTFDQYNEASRCRVVFDAGRYHPLKVRRFVVRFVQFLEGVCANPEVPMVDLLRQARGRNWWSRLVR